MTERPRPAHAPPGLAAARGWIRRDPLLALMLAGALVARVVFWLVTDRRWEDGLITITHARNAAEGLGLTHHLGEGPVHGFTSALSVLVPLVGEVVHRGAGFLAIRLASLATAVVSLVFAHRISMELNFTTWARGFVLAYLAFDFNQIFYGMAGMETQIAVAVYLVATYLVLKGRALPAGFAFGAGFLSRPDFALWIGPALLALFLRDRRAALKAGAIAGAVVAPWLAFTTIYYGSPMPHSLAAKAASFRVVGIDDLGALVDLLQSQATFLWRYFAPFFEDSFVLEAPLPHAALGAIAAVFGALALFGMWITRRSPTLWLLTSYALLFVAYRILFIPPGYSDWYMPPPMAAFALLAGAGITAARNWAVTPFLAVLLAGAFIAQLPFTIGLESRIQHEVENAVRVPLGRYLHDVVPDGEAVVSESAGYVGYYGRVLLWDFPGLTSPTSLRALRALPRDDRSMQRLIDRLRPEWLVLRPAELEFLRVALPETAAGYRLTRTIRVPIGDEIVFWGLTKRTVDTSFGVFRKAS